MLVWAGAVAVSRLALNYGPCREQLAREQLARRR